MPSYFRSVNVYRNGVLETVYFFTTSLLINQRKRKLDRIFKSVQVAANRNRESVYSIELKVD